MKRQDKVFISFLAIMITAGFIVGWAVNTTLKDSKYDAVKEFSNGFTVMPPGYSLVCNDYGEYKWKSTTHEKAYGTDKETAIKYAWYNYMDEVGYKECD